MNTVTSLLFLCPIIFMSSFMDAIAGGGGILSLPAYLFTGMPAHNVYACNKFCCCVGTTVSSIRFFKHGNVDLKATAFAGIFTFLSSALAARIVLLMPEQTVKVMLLVSLPVIAVLVLVQRRYPEVNHSGTLSKKQMMAGCLAVGLITGFYDGMLGPGSGTLAIILGTKILRYDLTTASGNAKVLLLASTFSSLIFYILAGKVLWQIALPVALFGVAGSYVGAGFAIRKGAKFIRPMMLLIAALLIVKMAADMTGIF